MPEERIVQPPREGRRLRERARAALQQYGLGEAHLQFLGRSENITFRVDLSRPRTSAEEGWRREKGRFLLRLHPPTGCLERDVWWTRGEALRSELAWLKVLRQDTGIAVPEPDPNQAGDLVTGVTLDGKEEPWTCTLMRWVQGRFLNQGMRSIHAYQVGVLLARLHQHATGWEAPQSFVRPYWDEGCLDAALAQLQTLLPGALLSRADFESYGAGVDSVRAVMDQLGRDREHFGLIHADLHAGNRLFFQQEARDIDFSGCGFGYYLFDIAGCLMDLGHRQAFLAGYESVRPLPEGHQRLTETFLVMSMTRNMAWLSGNPAEHEFLAHAIPHVARVIREKYLREIGFLFG